MVAILYAYMGKHGRMAKVALAGVSKCNLPIFHKWKNPLASVWDPSAQTALGAIYLLHRGFPAVEPVVTRDAAIGPDLRRARRIVPRFRADAIGKLPGLHSWGRLFG